MQLLHTFLPPLGPPNICVFTGHFGAGDAPVVHVALFVKDMIQAGAQILDIGGESTRPG